MNSVGTQPPRSRHYWRTIHRWVFSPIQRSYELRFFPEFWQLRAYWHKLTFWFSKFRYSARGGARTAVESASILLLIIQTVFGQTLLAGLLVGILAYFDMKLRATSPVLAWLANRSTAISAVLSWFHQNWPDASRSVSTLSTLAQISGLFLGLYFTAISVVAGTNYARVPAEILDALVREKVGNLYIRVVALFGGVSLILLGAVNLGYRPGVLNLAVVSFLGIASLFSFVELGRRAFYFLDSAQLVKFVAGDILKAASSASWSGFQWRDPAFQDHYRKQTDSNLRIYEDVVLLSDKEGRLQGRSLLPLVLQFLRLLELYSEQKKGIPTDSLWFERVYRHRGWLTTDEARVNIAVQTGTALEPEFVPDHSWIENRIGNLVSRTLNDLRERGDFDRAITVCARIEGTLRTLGNAMAVDEALSLFQRMKSFALEVAMETKLEGSVSSEVEKAMAPLLGLADMCGMGFISILLGLANQIESLSPEAFSSKLDAVNFRRPKTLYRTGLPRKVIEQLEYLYKGVGFEFRIEGKQISPQWYCRQIAALGMARYLVEACETLLKELENTYAIQAETLSRNKRYAFAAQVIQRGLEACHKFHFHIQKFGTWFNTFTALRRVQDIPWPDFDVSKIHGRIETVRDRLLIALADSVSGIASLPVTRHIPDYLGQAYVVLADECYKSLADGDEAQFEKLFAPFFAISIAVRDRLQVELQGRDDKVVAIYMTEPTEDLMAISGYALVYSELDSKAFWKIVKKSWDGYLSKVHSAPAVVKFLLTTMSYRRSTFTILPRDLQRTAWTQELMHHLREKGLIDDFFGPGPYSAQKDEARHQSPIIRVLARHSVLFERGADIFAACYLMERPDADAGDCPKGATDFAVRVKREAHRNTPPSEKSDEA